MTRRRERRERIRHNRLTRILRMHIARALRDFKAIRINLIGESADGLTRTWLLDWPEGDRSKRLQLHQVV